MRKRIFAVILVAGLLGTILSGSALGVPYTNVVNGTTNILAASFLITTAGISDMPSSIAYNKFRDAESWAGFETRGEYGADDTRGAVAGLCSFIAGHPIGSNGYVGVDLDNWSWNNKWKDMTRYGGDDRGGLIFWDYDLSAYLAGKDIGSIPGQSQFKIRVDYEARTRGLEAPFYISYNDGAGMTLDTTVLTNLTPSLFGTYEIVTNADHFVKVGAVPAPPPESGIVSFDITDHILASTDRVIRVAAFVTEYYGDITLKYASGIIETIVDLESAPPYLSDVAVEGSDMLVTFYSTTNRYYDVEEATDLAANDWTPIPGLTNIQGGNLTTTITNPVGSAAESVRVVGLPPETLFSEDFESSSTNDWTLDGSFVWEIGAPTHGATNAASGVNVAGTVLDGPYPENRTAGLLSPVIDLTSAGAATLSYWQYLYIEAFDWARVYVRDASGNPLASPLDLPIYEFDGDSAEYPWALNTVALPPEALGMEITFEFELESDIFDTFAGWYIDDLMILEQ